MKHSQASELTLVRIGKAVRLVYLVWRIWTGRKGIWTLAWQKGLMQMESHVEYCVESRGQQRNGERFLNSASLTCRELR